MPEGAHVQPARVAKRRYEEEHLGLKLADRDTAFTEVDLQPLTRPRLEPNCRSCHRHQFPTKLRHCVLD